MDLTFQEKSAWGLLLGIVAVSNFYFPAAFKVVAHVPHGVPLIGISILGIVVLAIIEAIYHAIIAVRSGDESDERDMLIGLKAERNASLILGFGLFLLIGFIVMQSIMNAYPVPNPLEIAVYILLLITVSEVAKLLSKILYYRLGA